MKVQIKITKPHKSISITDQFTLPAFCVLTGKNGSGKTHLLEAISKRDSSVVSINDNIISTVKYIPFNGLNPNITNSCNPSQIDTYITNVTNELNQLKRNYKHNSSNILSKIRNVNHKNLVLKTINNTRKKIEEITDVDLANNFEVKFMSQNDLFSGQFALIFKNYHRKYLENNMNKYYEAHNIKPQSTPLSDENFIQLYGSPPWDFVNQLLTEVNLPYEVNNPLGNRLESIFNFKLIDKKKQFEIDFRDLSTGEKVLMSLALAIYNSDNEIGKPDLLLIDEADAALHPSMSKKMIHIINKKIVQESNIPVIVTTHSPTTVIASEGISIYQLNRGNSIPQKIPTQKAIELLSSEIPFLKISTDNRRQIFVESKYDVQYYEMLSNILSRFEKLPAAPIFIPARTSNGSNCSDVISTVQNL